MAKKSAVEKNNHRKRLVARDKAKRAVLRALARNKDISTEERFQATMKLAQLPRNGAANRVRNRCALSGRPHGVFRKFELSRIALRDLASQGLLPGVVKSSW